MQDVIQQIVNLRKSCSFHFRKKLLSCGIAKESLNKSYLLPFTATKEVKLAMFQYKIIHNILATNSILYKMKKVAFPACPFCPSDCQNMHHLFISCPQASSFWYKFQRWYSTVCNASLLLSEPEVLFGITRPCTHRLTLNHLIMLGKYFLYINALNNTKFVFNDFISLVHDKIGTEKYIATTMNAEREFQPFKAFCCEFCYFFFLLVSNYSVL